MEGGIGLIINSHQMLKWGCRLWGPSTGIHGNSLNTPKINYGYALVDKDTREILNLQKHYILKHDILKVIWIALMLK